MQHTTSSWRPSCPNLEVSYSLCLMVQCEMFLSGRLGHLDGLAKEEKSQNANFNLIDKLYQISHHIPNTQQYCFSKHLTSTTLMYPSNMGILATQWTGVQ